MRRADTILEFWFGTLTAGFADAALRRCWFAVNPEFDQTIARQFGDLLDAANTGALNAWRETPRGCLSFMLVTDQFSRQIHRGSAQAFATDALALAAARLGIERGYDELLELDDRAFFYLPFEHSEAVADQQMSVTLFKRLRDATPPPHRHLTGQALRFAMGHRDIVLRYGRFPHRNLLLGRTSTAAELEFLVSANRFWQ